MNQVTYVLYAILVVVGATLISHTSGTSHRSWGNSGGGYYFSSGGGGYGNGGGWTGGSFHK